MFAPPRIAMSSTTACYKDMVVTYKEPALPMVGRSVTIQQALPDFPNIQKGWRGLISDIDEYGRVYAKKGTTTVTFTTTDIRAGLVQVGGWKTWSSWSDPSSGKYSTEIVLPHWATDITVQFYVKTIPTGRIDVNKYDRQRQAFVTDSTKGPDVFKMPPGVPLDVHFYLAGGMNHCAVIRAWNVALPEHAAREPWECWPIEARTSFLSSNSVPMPVAQQTPCVLTAALGAGDNPASRRKASSQCLYNKQADLLTKFRELKASHNASYYGHNIANTISAGLAIASAATIMLPPVSIGLGLGSAAVGLGSSGTEMTVDTFRDSTMRSLINEMKWELETYQALEQEFLLESIKQLKKDQPHNARFQKLYDLYEGVIEAAVDTYEAVQPAKLIVKDGVTDCGVAGFALAAEITYAEQAAKLAEVAKATADAAEAAEVAAKASAAAATQAVQVGMESIEKFQAGMKAIDAATDAAVAADAAADVAKAAAAAETAADAARAGSQAAQTMKAIGNVMTIAGAVVSVGVCVYGWASTKDTSKMVNESIQALEESNGQLETVLDDPDSPQ